jgi:hypothetical protein
VLQHPPSPSELERLYYELAQLGAPSVGRRVEWTYQVESREHLVAIAAEMLRWDPRLLSILLSWFTRSWDQLDLIRMRRWLSRMRSPQTLLVLLEFARAARPTDPELRHAAGYLSAGFRPVDPPERFFFDIERPGSRRAERKLGRNLQPYSRWGFIGTERPAMDVFDKSLVGRYDAATRQRIARELAQSRPISIAEYLDAIDHSVSRPQAVHDLRAAGLRLQGRGRGARWSVPG